MSWSLQNWSWGKEARLTGLACGVYFFYLLYGFFQERALSRRYGDEEERLENEVFVLLFPCLVSTIVALIAVRGRPTPCTMEDHFVFARMSVAYFSATLASNMAIRYISYPAQVLGKSLKPAAIAVANLLVNDKRYPRYKYIALAAVIGGILLYSLCPTDIHSSSDAPRQGDDSSDDRDGQISASAWGIALIVFSLLADGLTGSLQDRVDNSRFSAFNLQLQANAWSLVILGAFGLVSGNLTRGLSFVLRHPEALIDILLFSTTAAIGQVFIYVIVVEHGSLTVSIVTTMRKFSTILISVLFLHLDLMGPGQWLGVAFVFMGLGLDVLKSHNSHHNNTPLPIDHRLK